MSLDTSIPLSEHHFSLPDEARNVAAAAAVYSASESEADDHDLRHRAQEDASVLYAKPARRGKTRTFSDVSLHLSFLLLWLGSLWFEFYRLRAR